MGATYEMVRAVIGHLRAAQTPPLPPPSKRWFADWLKANKNLHTIKTKPIKHARLESHTEEDVKKWFVELGEAIKKYKINSSKKILNIDESGVRVRCPSRESVIVPTEVKELYTASPENRKSLTVLETIRGDGKKTLPPFIITPGEKIMEN
ncbi:hypothetical protein BKA61DRAFT_583519 [Leptodontidium sp. MPI-SDFR-AT-0119]|nr:hypothetical protein BKA61DRAFT_583519 [Leptodontidium sp. MPI-SDFR-AT-0119]